MVTSPCYPEVTETTLTGAIRQMPKPLFHSETEKRLFAKLRSRWSKYVDAYPHIPVRNVLEYEEISKLDVSDRARDYLLRTEFDFVVCDKRSVPLLAVEFDGLGHGFSRDGQYVSNIVSLQDPHRALKLGAKLDACDRLLFPVVVVSFPEIAALGDAGAALMVLDAVIAEVLTAVKLNEAVTEQMAQLLEALIADPSGEAVDAALTAIEVDVELTNNPIRRKTAEIASTFPLWNKSMTFLDDREGFAGACFAISAGIEIHNNQYRRRELVSFSCYIREVNCSGASTTALLECIGEYCLAKRALATFGTDPRNWSAAIEAAPWVER